MPWGEHSRGGGDTHDDLSAMSSLCTAPKIQKPYKAACGGGGK